MMPSIKSRHLLFYIAGLCIAFLAFAVYMQHFQGVDTCPMCVLQRYAFAAIAIFCLVGAIVGAPKVNALFGFIAALSGAGVAAWQVWLSMKPGVGCGLDPMETVVNKLITAKWLPFLFYAEGSCSNDNFRLFGLTVPQWSLFWFAAFVMVLGWIMFRRGRR